MRSITLHKVKTLRKVDKARLLKWMVVQKIEDMLPFFNEDEDLTKKTNKTNLRHRKSDTVEDPNTASRAYTSET